MNINPIRILNPTPNPNPNHNHPVMENPFIINPIDIQLIKSHPPTDDNDDDADDIEMFAFQSMSYITLKDLIPSSPSSLASPTSGSSWREIPMKDPLLQHAAWAYLQPMEEARDEHGHWWRRLRTDCCGLLGCFNDVVLASFRGLFPDQGSRDGDDVYDDDNKKCRVD